MGGIKLIRVEAVKILKEILVSCSNMEGKSVKIMPPGADSVTSKGYQIHIQNLGDGSGNSCIHRIAKKHDLSIRDEGTFFVIYKPAVV